MITKKFELEERTMKYEKQKFVMRVMSNKKRNNEIFKFKIKKEN